MLQKSSCTAVIAGRRKAGWMPHNLRNGFVKLIGSLRKKELKTETICSCFAKARIAEKKCADALLDVDNPFKDLKDQLEMLAVLP